MNRTVRIIALTEAGKRLAFSLEKCIPDADIWFKPNPFKEKVQASFQDGDALIMICATGIAVRTLASVIKNKHDDPPVLVLDESGRFVIPLLSGHEGGANDWAHNVAEYIQAQSVITTAKSYLHPVYTVGMGCERGCSKEELETLLFDCLAKANLVLEDIASINSIDIKVDEQGLIALASSFNKPYQVFDKLTLRKVEHLLSMKSEYIYKTVGVYGVAESAALWAGKKLTEGEVELVVNKMKTTRATCSIARSFPLANSNKYLNKIY